MLKSLILNEVTLFPLAVSPKNKKPLLKLSVLNDAVVPLLYKKLEFTFVDKSLILFEIFSSAFQKKNHVSQYFFP